MFYYISAHKRRGNSDRKSFAESAGFNLYFDVLYDISRYSEIREHRKKDCKIEDRIAADTKEDAPLLRRILRNIFWVFGPLELLAYALSGTRLGDRAAKTEVVPR